MKQADFQGKWALVTGASIGAQPLSADDDDGQRRVKTP